MGRKPKTAEQELQETMAALAKATGIDIGLLEKHVTEDVVDTKDDIILEAETVLYYYSTKGQGFTRQQCPECGLEFAYYYRSVLGPGMKCSNTCRRSAFAKIGIRWSPTKKPADRYELEQGEDLPYMYPAVIPPSALSVLDKALGVQQKNANEPG